MAEPTATLVLAIAFRYALPVYQKFVGTLRAHYDGGCALIVSNATRDTHAYCEQHNVQLHEAASVGLNPRGSLQDVISV